MTSPVCALLPAEPVLPTPPPGVYRGDRPEIFLWPANGPRDTAPGAFRSVTANFGPGLDRGALRRRPDGSWEYLDFNGWTPWQPSIRSHLVAASAFRRYGVGWSFGPAWNGHTEHLGYAQELCGVDLAPDSMAALDLEHSNLLFRQLEREWKAKFAPGTTPVDPPPPPPRPEPTPTPTPTPTPVPVPVPTPVPSAECAAWAAAKVEAWAPVLAELRGSSLGRQLFRPGFEEALRQALEADCALGPRPGEKP